MILTDVTSLLPSIMRFFWISLLILIVFYVYSGLTLMTIAKKTNTPNAWLAWIPVANMYLMTQIAQVPWWTLLIVLAASAIPIIGVLGMVSIMAWWWWKIAERRGFQGWVGLLTIIPLVNLVVMGVLAWSD